ncbi:hypothetical protein [Botrimarina sp.]|uniref:hypothetical protein n=1 Tax=Botrimarina sp. TaxID=2795802 RepID=UPI0032EDD5AD
MSSDQLAARAARGDNYAFAGLVLREAGNNARGAASAVAEAIERRTSGGSSTLAAVGGFFGHLVRVGGEVLAGAVDLPGTASAGLRDLGEAVDVGERHGVALGIGQTVGTNHIAYGIVGHDLDNPVDRAAAYKEGAGRLVGTVLASAGSFATVRKLGHHAPVKPGDSGTFGDLKSRKRRAGETEALDIDHQPSLAAQRKALEDRLGRQLDVDELKALKNNTPAVASPRTIHQQTSPTYGGRNTPARIAEDSADLGAAALRDRRVFDEAMGNR